MNRKTKFLILSIIVLAAFSSLYQTTLRSSINDQTAEFRPNKRAPSSIKAFATQLTASTYDHLGNLKRQLYATNSQFFKNDTRILRHVDIKDYADAALNSGNHSLITAKTAIITKHNESITLKKVSTTHHRINDDQTTDQLTIYADKMLASKKTNTLSYSGHVTLHQDNIKLAADKIVVIIEDNKIKTLAAFGDKLTMDITEKDGKDSVYIEAHKLNYYADKDYIEIFTQAKIRFTNKTITGDYIKYNINTSEVELSSSAADIISKNDDQKPKRISITIE